MAESSSSRLRRRRPSSACAGAKEGSARIEARSALTASIAAGDAASTPERSRATAKM
jgi:hypothetical protein